LVAALAAGPAAPQIAVHIEAQAVSGAVFHADVNTGCVPSAATSQARIAGGGVPIEHIDLPERCADVCFGGYRRSRLFMVASRSLYALWVSWPLGPSAFRRR
jgi:hypothetical protein